MVRSSGDSSNTEFDLTDVFQTLEDWEYQLRHLDVDITGDFGGPEL